MVACVEYDEFIIEYYTFCSHFAVLLVLVERLRFTFTAHGKRQTSVENFSK